MDRAEEQEFKTPSKGMSYVLVFICYFCFVGSMVGMFYFLAPAKERTPVSNGAQLHKDISYFQALNINKEKKHSVKMQVISALEDAKTRKAKRLFAYHSQYK